MKRLAAVILIAALLCAPLCGLCEGEWRAVVVDADTSDRVHLRAGPSTATASLGLYFTGTEAECREIPGSEWAEVRIGAETGCMMTKYLGAAPVTPRQMAGRTTAAVPLSLTPGAQEQGRTVVPEGAYVWILGETQTKWYYVQIGLECGYLPESCVAFAEGMGRPGYDGILEEYAAALAAQDSAGMWWVNGECTINCVYGARLGYAFMDFDGNGVDELVIGETAQSEYMPGMIYNVYTLDNGYPRVVLNGWTRSSFTYSTDGRFINNWSNGAGNSGTSAYRIVDGQALFCGCIELDTEGARGEASPWYYLARPDDKATAENAVSERFASEWSRSVAAKRTRLELLPLN